MLPANSGRNPNATNTESGAMGNVPPTAPIDPATITLRRHAHLVHTRLPRPLFLGPGTPTPPPTGTTLQGLGASSGTVRGTALVLPAHAPLPHALAPDQIAVLVALDPAWTALMAHARGLIIERGGLLSHAAILAREYRVPLVIGLDHATTHLKTGDPIELNGNTGTVTRLSIDN
jgi:pyruvate,water dikinase